MDDWVRTGFGETERWHRLAGTSDRPGLLLTACDVFIPDDVTVEHHQNPPEHRRCSICRDTPGAEDIRPRS